MEFQDESTKNDTVAYDNNEKEIDSGTNKPTGNVSLDPNHNHFLLVDDGSNGNFGTEITFRAA
jgi:hypothetical protein